MSKSILLLSLLFALPTRANLNPRPEERSPMTAMPARFDLLLGGARSEGTGSSYTWQQLSLDGGYALQKEINDELKLFYGINYRLTKIDQGRFPTGSRLDDLHDIILPLSFNYAREGSPWSFFGQVSAQVATDFSSLTSADLDYTFRLGGQYQYSDTFAFNFGVARVRNFGETFILPAVGFVWAPRDDWSLTLVGPRLTLSHRLSERVILRGGGFPMGGQWNVEEDNGDSVDYGFASYNLGLGIDYKLRHGLWLSVWGGTNFANEFRAEEGGDTLFERDLDPGWFAYVGLSLYEW